jgi:hypothetical protein
MGSISSMAIMFNVTSETEDQMQESLLKTMEEAQFPSGQPVFTTASVVGLLFFFMNFPQLMTCV